MTDFIKAFLFVVVAEMGDKTQLLAIAMAGKYKVRQVMIGVFVATIFNHTLAVVVGNYLSSLIPMTTVKTVAAISFIIFGLWTLRGDKIDDDEKKKSKFGPIITVAIAFFIAEMGDKTQLMTIAIAAESNVPIFILMGTTVGMLIADGIGIIGGSWMCKHIPEKYIKWGAGIIFMLFGTITIYESVSLLSNNIGYMVGYLLIIGLLIYIFGIKLAYPDQACEINFPNNEDNEKDKDAI